MELRPGYKQTEVGMIPEAWEVTSVGSLATFTSGKGISVTALHRHSSDFPVPVFGGNGIAGYTTTPLVCERSIVVGRVGQKCGEVYVTDGPAWITDNALYPRRISRPLDVRYFALALEAAGLNDVKNRNDLPLVTQSILHAVRIAWPPKLAEQRAISEAVGDIDALLSALTQLIAKKRDLKQAAMQQLLTRQTRLPGFSGEWEMKRLGDALKVRHGKSQHGVAATDGMYPILATGGEIGRTNHYLYDRPSVLIGRKGTIDAPQFVETPFWTIDTLFFTEIADDASPKFIFYKFTTINWRSYNEASGVPSLNTSTIESIGVRVPQLAEQTAIATVLSDMDAEIAALEQRLAKTRALKQGMMQELLTGRTRLV